MVLANRSFPTDKAKKPKSIARTTTHHGDIVVHVVAVDTILDTGLVALVPAPVAPTDTLPGPVDFCTAAREKQVVLFLHT